MFALGWLLILLGALGLAGAGFDRVSVQVLHGRSGRVARLRDLARSAGLLSPYPALLRHDTWPPRPLRQPPDRLRSLGHGAAGSPLKRPHSPCRRQTRSGRRTTLRWDPAGC